MKIEKMLPFMDEEDVYEIAKEIVCGDLDVKLESVVPYMDEDDVGKLVKYAIENDFDVNISAIVPFMDEDDVYEFAKEALKHNCKFNLMELVPLMDEEHVDKICKQLLENPDECDIDLTQLYTFVSEKCADDVFLYYAGKGKMDENALPFVSEKCLHKFVQAYCENPDYDVDIDTLYPYLSSKDLSLLLKTYLKQRKQSQNSND